MRFRERWRGRWPRRSDGSPVEVMEMTPRGRVYSIEVGLGRTVIYGPGREVLYELFPGETVPACPDPRPRRVLVRRVVEVLEVL